MDETQPLLVDRRVSTEPEHDDSIDKNIVDFDIHGDPENPMDWPRAYKWAIVTLLAMTAFTVTFTCVSVVPIADHIVRDLSGGRSDKSSSVLLVTVWEFGEAGGPLLIAPLSELCGRYPVIIVANILFIAATTLAALSSTTSSLIVARALTGLCVTVNVLNPAIVGDIFIPEQRGTAMSVIMMAPLLGGAVGPAIAGAITESMGWRSVLWLSVILASVCELFFLTCFHETYKVAALRKKTARLRKETGNLSLRTKFDVDDSHFLSHMATAIMRPFIVFYGSGVLQLLSVIGSVNFTFFYIVSISLPEITQGVYGLSPAMTGLAFLSFSAGSFVSVITCRIALDRIFVRLRDTHKGIEQPEYRLPLAILGVTTLPLFVALYGWIAQLHLHLSLLLFSVAFMGMTMLLGYLPLSTYVVDATGLYSASAMTALIVIRCIASTFLPLTTGPLVNKFGYGFAFTILGGILLFFSPILTLLYVYGAKWRQRSIYTKLD